MRIYLKKVNENDFEDFYKLKCEKENIYWTNYIKEPEKGELLNWYKIQLKNDNRNFFLVRNINGDSVVGYAYIDKIENREKTFEISYAISEKYMGYKLGVELVKILTNYCIKSFGDIKEIHAWVFQNNIKSKKCLLRNGWIETSEKRDEYFKYLKVNEVMVKFKI